MYPWQMKFYAPSLFGNGVQRPLSARSIVGRPSDPLDVLDPLAPSPGEPEDALGPIGGVAELVPMDAASADQTPLQIVDFPGDMGRKSECIARCYHLLGRRGGEWNFHKCVNACMQGLRHEG